MTNYRQANGVHSRELNCPDQLQATLSNYRNAEIPLRKNAQHSQ